MTDLSPSSVIRVLLIEDNLGDAVLAKEHLSEAGSHKFLVQHVGSVKAASTYLDQRWDVILSDLSLPDSEGLETLRIILENCGDVPVVVMSGREDQQIALDSVRRGAQDYLVKGKVDGWGLARSLNYSIERAKTQRQLLESKNQAKILAESAKRLTEINLAQQRFVSDAAHELRAPLTTILGNIQTIRRFPHMSIADRDQAMLETEHEANRMTRLVADLLSLARGESGEEIRKDRFWLTDLITKTIEESHYLITGQPVKFLFDQEISINGNSDLIQQLIVILLENAVKYSRGDNSISVTTKTYPRKVLLSVEDHGAGIAPEDLTRIFERFYRTDQSRSQNSGGSGLGLSIAKRIAEAHNGTITASSILGQGTIFTVALPLEEESTV